MWFLHNSWEQHKALKRSGVFTLPHMNKQATFSPCCKHHTQWPMRFIPASARLDLSHACHLPPYSHVQLSQACDSVHSTFRPHNTLPSSGPQWPHTSEPDLLVFSQEYEARASKLDQSLSLPAQGRRKNLEFEPLSTTALILEDRPAWVSHKTVPWPGTAQNKSCFFQVDYSCSVE